MNSPDRLRIWLEQGNVQVSQLFFKQYKTIGMLDNEAMVILHLQAFLDEGNDFPTPSELANRMEMDEKAITKILQKLLQSHFITIEKDEDVNGTRIEKYSLFPLWEKVIDSLVNTPTTTPTPSQQVAEGEIFSLFEKEFGRLLSPMECETITMWIDHDQHSPEIIRAALKEAVLAQKVSLRYIDRILFEWKKKNIRSLQQIEQHSKSFRTFQSTNQVAPSEKK